MDLDDEELEATRNKFYLKSEKQKIIDLENEIIFLKDTLREKQKEIEELKKENNEIWTHLPRLD